MADQRVSSVEKEMEPPGSNSLDIVYVRVPIIMWTKREFIMSCRSGRTNILLASVISTFNTVVKWIMIKCELLMSDPFPFFEIEGGPDA